MLTIRHDQLQTLSEVMLKQFEDGMVVHLQSAFPDQAGTMPESNLRQMIQQGVKSAANYKVETEADVQHYLELMFQIGPDFDTNSQSAWAQPILKREDLWPWEKLDEIENHAALLTRGGG